MSRIGRMPITIPAGVTVDIADNNLVTVKGPKGTLQQSLSSDMKIEIDGDVITVTRPSDDRQHRSLHGLTRAIINNMVHGVTHEFERILEINGVGYKAAAQGKTLVLNLGYSHPINVEAPEGITFTTPDPNKIIVKGADKQAVGQIAAEIRAKRPPEPYLGKGVKYNDEHIRRKTGKAGK
ncbi:MAG TPA: 50S ribosomal protein L6 [Bacillota bacterium]|nr:50S ribosomal protein L6 [Bacillota bacterium]